MHPFPTLEDHLQTQSAHVHESLPFLLVRPSSTVEELDDMDTVEIPSSRSVPPHAPPARVVTTETDLPSVIVDLRDLERNETLASMEIDGLLADPIEIPLPAIEIEYRPQQPTLPSVEAKAAPRAPSGRGWIFGLVAAAMALGGGAFVGARALHASGHSLGAALHITR